MDYKTRFEFGKNWTQFVEKHFSIERVEIAKSHLLNFLEIEDLKGLKFLDIGCGSGIHSLAAQKAKAETVFSFDYDQCSVNATQLLRESYGNMDNWAITQGSVLNSEFLKQLPKFDIVYSWGVLHHTGDVWNAIRNASGLVKPHGQFYIALYSANVHTDPPPEFWIEVKQRYISSSESRKRLMEAWYIWRFMLHKNLLRIPVILTKWIQYKKSRGMNMLIDIRDWLGGWPMEFVYDQDAVEYIEKLGFKLIKMATGEANTEFLFTKDN